MSLGAVGGTEPILKVTLSGFVFTLVKVSPLASMERTGRTVELSRGLAAQTRATACGPRQPSLLAAGPAVFGLGPGAPTTSELLHNSDV